MKLSNVITATTALTMCAGLAAAQPTVDGIYDPGTEGSFYGDHAWINAVPTGFGDNGPGLFQGGDFGNPGDVTTGIEVRIPLASLGLSGTETIRLAGWVNSGDRTFMSNQIIGDLPIDTTNIGNAPDFTAAPYDTTTQHIEIDLSTAGTMAPSMDGSLSGDGYVNFFLQGNYTGFGDEQDGTIDGVGAGGGGSEIDGVYASVNGGFLYLMITGNIENNGNGLDLFFDTAAGGSTVLSSSSGDGDFIVSGQSGLDFDSGFDADYVFSVAVTDTDSDPETDNVPTAYMGPIGGPIDNLGDAPSYGALGNLSGSVQLYIDNSNVEGVIGTQSQSTPVSPDANWAYGSELNNVRVYMDEMNNRLYVFIAGNLENNYNKLNLFFDAAPGGQNVLRDDNVDISFNNLNAMSNITFDTGFEPDYWMDINNGVDGGSGDLINFTDAATLRTDGALIDPTFLVLLDYGAYFSGSVTDSTGNPVAMPIDVMDFSGPQVDIQDGTLPALYTQYGPRLTQINPNSPTAGLIQVSINNSNVAGVTDSSAAGAADVNTGIEVCIDLDELGWDGSQDILMGGWISNAGFDFLSNQVFGTLPTNDNVGPRDSDNDGTNDLDFTMIDGDQFINLMDIAAPTCPADLTGDGAFDFFDISALLQGQVDFNGDTGFDFFDISAFLQAGATCP